MGNFALESYRLTAKVLELHERGDPFTPERWVNDTPKQHCTSVLFTVSFFSVLESNLKHSEMFEELPVVLRNSPLVNALMCEMDSFGVPPPKMDLFNLSMK